MLKYPVRARRVAVAPEVLAQMFREGERFAAFHVAEGVPPDAEHVDTYYDSEHRCVVLVFTHPAWEPAASLGEIPFLTVVYRTGEASNGRGSV